MTTDYFDTSVVYAALVTEHDLQESASKLIQNSYESGHTLVTALHTTAELYNNLTRQGSVGASWPPGNVTTALEETLLPIFEMLTLDQEDYTQAINRCERLGLIRAIIYDALHYQAALKCGATTLYTDNVRDFNRLREEGDSIEIIGLRP